MPERKDIFVNQAYLSVVESAANTLTFSKLETGINIYEKVGWLINRLDYFYSIKAANFAATDDAFVAGLSSSNQITSVPLNSSAVIDRIGFDRQDFGTAANAIFFEEPLVKDFSRLPGGGLLVPPNPIFIFVKGTALTTAITVSARMFYTVVELKTEDFWELVEQRRMIGT